MPVVEIETELARELLDELRTLREQRQHQPMWEFPARVTRAVVQPEKYTSTLPTIVMAALRRFAAYRGGENINVVVSGTR